MHVLFGENPVGAGIPAVPVKLRSDDFDGGNVARFVALGGNASTAWAQSGMAKPTSNTPSMRATNTSK